MSTPAGGTALVRAVAVGNRITLPATEQAFVAELGRIAGLGARYLSPSRPNLLVLGEVLGLPAAFTGQRALLARHASTALLAMTELVAPLLPRLLRCCRLWPGVSLPRALLLAATDALYRPFAETLARLAARHHTYLVATTLAPRVRRSDDPRDIARWGTRGTRAVYLPTGPEVYNAALVFGPDGTLLERVNKVYQTQSSHCPRLSGHRSCGRVPTFVRDAPNAPNALYVQFDLLLPAPTPDAIWAGGYFCQNNALGRITSRQCTSRALAPFRACCGMG